MPDIFWTLTPAEVIEILHAKEKKIKAQAKEDISKIFLLASLINRFFTAPEGSAPPQPWDYFPDLFQEEMAQAEQVRSDEALERAKESRKRFAKLNNELRGLQ